MEVLWCLGFLAYLVIKFGSNQTPVQFYISRFTFNAQTGWYRLAIWEYGSASVLNHPLFGIGFADWTRPLDGERQCRQFLAIDRNAPRASRQSSYCLVRFSASCLR